jgi:hypothetical protein
MKHALACSGGVGGNTKLVNEGKLDMLLGPGFDSQLLRAICIFSLFRIQHQKPSHSELESPYTDLGHRSVASPLFFFAFKLIFRKAR